MAITFLQQNFQREYVNDVNGQQTGVKAYFVYSNTSYTDLDSLVSDAVTAGLPDVGSAYSGTSTDLILFEHTVEVFEAEKELKFYQIRCDYESDKFWYGLPTSRPWNITFSSAVVQQFPQYSRTATAGIDSGLPAGKFIDTAANRLVFNSAGYPFDPTPPQYLNKVRINLQKNFANITDIGTISNIKELQSYVTVCNDDSVTIAGLDGDKYEFYIEDIRVTKTENNGEEYYDTNFQILWDPHSHLAKILDAGWQRANGKVIRWKNGALPNQPVPLDGAGDPVAGNDPATRIANSRWMLFGLQAASDYDVLGLPTTF